MSILIPLLLCFIAVVVCYFYFINDTDNEMFNNFIKYSIQFLPLLPCLFFPCKESIIFSLLMFSSNIFMDEKEMRIYGIISYIFAYLYAAFFYFFNNPIIDPIRLCIILLIMISIIVPALNICNENKSFKIAIVLYGLLCLSTLLYVGTIDIKNNYSLLLLFTGDILLALNYMFHNKWLLFVSELFFFSGVIFTCYNIFLL